MKYIALFFALVLLPYGVLAESYYIVGGVGQSESDSAYITTRNLEAYQVGAGVRFGNIAVESTRHKISDDLRSAYATTLSVVRYFTLPSRNYSDSAQPLLKAGFARVNTPFKDGVARSGLTYGVGLEFKTGSDYTIQITAESLNTGVETIYRVPVLAFRLVYNL